MNLWSTRFDKSRVRLNWFGRSRIVLWFSSILTLIIGTSASFADDTEIVPLHCPPSYSIDKPIRTHDRRGVPLAREYWTNPQGIWHKIPYGYWNPQRRIGSHEEFMRSRAPDNPMPKGAKRGETTGVGFSFWMPSLRYQERRASGGGYRSCENGRPIPRPDQYKVAGNLFWAGGKLPPRSNLNGYFPKDPKDAFETVKQYYPENLKAIKNEFGLLRLGQYGAANAVNYISELDSDFRVVLECFPKGTGGAPICVGHFHWVEESVVLRLAFPYAKRAEWQKIVDSTRTLFARWRQSALDDFKNFKNVRDKGLKK